MNQTGLKFNEKTCFCNPKAKKQLVAVAGCSDDLAAVSALPNDWVPRNCGPTLINFLKNREKDHEVLLKNLSEEALSINKDIDGKVRNIAEILLCDIRQNEADIESVIVKSQSNNIPLSIADRDNALKQVSKLSLQRIEDLVKFKQESLGLERLRADGLRNLLKCQFQRLIAVGHKPPSDLLHEFDEQIYDINHQLLSNSRAYTELEAQFRLQLDECIVCARSVINQCCLSAAKSLRTRSSLPWVKHLSFSQKNNTHNEKSQILNDDSSLTKTDFEEVKKSISYFVETYNEACLKVFKKFSDQLDQLYDNISDDNFSICRSSDSFNVNKSIDDAIDLISKRSERYNLEYNNLNKILYTYGSDLQKQLSSLIMRLHDTLLFLSDLCHIWHDYTNRSSLVQKFTLLGLEDLQTTQDALELSNEVNFNVALEQMRCASDLDKLQQQFDIVTNYINKKIDIYYQQKETESAKLEDFMKLPLILSQVLQSEFYCLLDKHPKVPIQLKEHSITPTDSVSAMEELFSLRIPLLQAILQIHLQEQEISECTNNCLESFENIFLEIPEIINCHSRKWIDTKSSLVNMRSSLKLMSHSVRAERVKAAREARLNELRYHDWRLNSHLDAIYNLIDRLPIEASEFSAIDAPELYPFCKWINDIKLAIDTILVTEDVDPEFKRLKMSSYALRLVKHRELFEESLDSAINTFKRVIESDVQKARISNVRFMSRLKLFFEGGRYAAAEAIRTCNALVKAGDVLESCLNRTMDALHQRRTQLLALADQQMLPLQRIVEDVCKHGAKSAFDKKKLPQNKSK